MNNAGRVLWRRLTHNIGWKLGSLAVAVLLWFAVEGQPELVTMHEIPILYRNLAGGLVLGSDSLVEVRAELRGSSGKLSDPALAETFVALDLSRVTGPGEQTFTLANGDFSLPQGVTLLRAMPSQVRLNFDRIASREVPVHVRLNGEPAKGYRIASHEVTPEKLRISGPEGRVNQVESAETDAIDVQSLVETTQVQVNAFIADPRIQFQTPPAPVVSVTLKLEKTR